MRFRPCPGTQSLSSIWTGLDGAWPVANLGSDPGLEVCACSREGVPALLKLGLPGLDPLAWNHLLAGLVARSCLSRVLLGRWHPRPLGTEGGWSVALCVQPVLCPKAVGAGLPAVGKGNNGLLTSGLLLCWVHVSRPRDWGLLGFWGWEKRKLLNHLSRLRPASSCTRPGVCVWDGAGRPHQMASMLI